jgi:hypothetical protein
MAVFEVAIQHWSLSWITHVRDVQPERHIVFSAPFDETSRDRLQVKDDLGFVHNPHTLIVRIHRVFSGLPDFNPPITDVAPVGAARYFEDRVRMSIYPGEAVFDELWVRNVNGATMPSHFEFVIRGPGKPLLMWNVENSPHVAVFGTTFRVRQTEFGSSIEAADALGQQHPASW